MNSRLSRTPKLRDMAAPNQCEARGDRRLGQAADADPIEAGFTKADIVYFRQSSVTL
jgi:hypothetical protein